MSHVALYKVYIVMQCNAMQKQEDNVEIDRWLNVYYYVQSRAEEWRQT